jgi:excisionase family DNA binding protein
LTDVPVNNPISTAGEELLTPAEAAMLARCSLRTLRRAYASGGLAAYRSPGGRSIRLLRHEVIAFFLAEPAVGAPLRRGSPRARAAPKAVNGAADPLSVARIRAHRA